MIVLPSGKFLVVALPFFGIIWVTLATKAILEVAQVLQLWVVALPNGPWLYQWLPRGFTMFIVGTVHSAFLTWQLVRLPVASNDVRSNYV
jgi:hypothetical protein